jgi:hypothetical protein
MKAHFKHVRILFRLAPIYAAMMSAWPCHGHDWQLHEQITISAFQSSSGLSAFFNETLGGPNSPLIADISVPVNIGDVPTTPVGWLQLGSVMEDEQFYGKKEVRTMDHFYTVVPVRIPGQVVGLTDKSEGPVIIETTGIGLHSFGGSFITNSFAWSALPNIPGPSISILLFPVANVGTNVYNWLCARTYEYAALTNASQSDRDTSMAMMLYTLGHVLHLNQDLSQPDHVRNDNHYVDAAAYIENYGVTNYSNNPSWFTTQAHGWPYWQSNNFSKLLDFWDRGLYTNGSSQALRDEAGGSVKLGLAEWCNGNFLGERALYMEGYNFLAHKHKFPFPSLRTSTDYPNPANVVASHLKNGLAINRMNVRKNRDGIIVNNHSVLLYMGAKFPQRPTKHSMTINDTNVLQEYHSLILPKAVEYSAGILDYYFRGTLDTSFDADGTNNLVITNTSSQALTNGSFQLYYDDAGGTRTELTGTNFTTLYGNFLAAGDTVEAYFTPVTNVAVVNYILVYQGTIGTTNGSASDPVDANIAIAAKTFSVTNLNFNNLVWDDPPDGFFGNMDFSNSGNAITCGGSFGGGVGGQVSNSGSLVYTGPDVDCNAHIVISGANGGAGNAWHFEMFFPDGTDFLINSDSTLGTFDFPFTVPESVAGVVTITYGATQSGFNGSSLSVSVSLTPIY